MAQKEQFLKPDFEKIPQDSVGITFLEETLQHVHTFLSIFTHSHTAKLVQSNRELSFTVSADNFLLLRVEYRIYFLTLQVALLFP